MGIEIERKFLVVSDAWRAGAEGLVIRQGYICAHQDTVVRVRTFGADAFLTVKGGKTGESGNAGLVRAEFEYPIPLGDAAEILDALCRGPLIEKTRYTLHHLSHEWVIDEFTGVNAGLTVAEVELASEDEAVALPPWIGREVSSDPRFLNVNLAARPFSAWPAAERAAIVP